MPRDVYITVKIRGNKRAIAAIENINKRIGKPPRWLVKLIFGKEIFNDLLELVNASIK